MTIMDKRKNLHRMGFTNEKHGEPVSGDFIYKLDGNYVFYDHYEYMVDILTADIKRKDYKIKRMKEECNTINKELKALRAVAAPFMAKDIFARLSNGEDMDKLANSYGIEKSRALRIYHKEKIKADRIASIVKNLK